MKSIFSVAVFLIASGFSAGATYFIPGQLVNTESEETDAYYPAIAVDNVEVTITYIGHEFEVFGRPHIVWTESDCNDEWRTFYRVGNDTGSNWSDIQAVDQERIPGESYKTYSSEIPTRPSIAMDPDDDRADIVFCQQKNEWFYLESIPEEAFVTREILFSWKTPFSFPQESIDPPDFIHHVSGLEMDVREPFVLSMKFKPAQIYYDGVFWSQNDPADHGESTIYYDYQAGGDIEMPKNVDWGEITRAGDLQESTGHLPFAATGLDKTIGNPLLTDTRMLAVVSENSDGIQCKLLNVPNMEDPHIWDSIDFDGAGLAYPACAFQNNGIRQTATEPDLYVVYRAPTGQSGRCKYVFRKLDHTWEPGNREWSDPPLTIAECDTSESSRPVITVTENDTVYVAYIGEDSQVYVAERIKGETTSFVSTQITHEDAYEDGENHHWVYITTDTVSLEGGYLWQLAYDGVDRNGYRCVYWSRQLPD
jgi:hypothetical protein